MEVIEFHDRIVNAALSEGGGRAIKHTGDGIMSSFTYVSRAVSCAMRIQREFAGSAEGPADGARVRIGISAGEPVDRSDDMFGASVNLASRICGHADAGQILASSAARCSRSARGSCSPTVARWPSRDSTSRSGCTRSSTTEPAGFPISNPDLGVTQIAGLLRLRVGGVT